MPEMKRVGIACQLFSDIIEHYGVVEKEGHLSGKDDIVTEVVRYIYDHYSENTTLATLAEVFYLSPKALRKKLRKRLCVDLRIFINDVRAQKVMEMRNDPMHKKKTLSEIALLCGFRNMSTFYRSYSRNFKGDKPQEL